MITDMPARLLAQATGCAGGRLDGGGSIRTDRCRPGGLLPVHIAAWFAGALRASTLSGASEDNTTLIAGSAFSWNVFDYGRIGNNVRVQDARLQQAITGLSERRIAGSQRN